MLRKLFGAARAPASARPCVPDGERIYAIGDVHGRLDLLDQLLASIDADDVTSTAARTTVIFLGDLVDRGANSAGVVERLATLPHRFSEVRFLMGNHEEIFLAALAGDAKALKLFCRVGGRETMLSYGIGVGEYERLDYAELQSRMAAVVPDRHRDFLSGFEAMVIRGDYAFVHAGVRPGVPFPDQNPADLRWIRTSFLDHREPLEKMVVHGHTIEPEVVYRPHRIGIDTGAYDTGRLTALVLEGDATRLLQTSP